MISFSTEGGLMLLHDLEKRKLIGPPKWLPDNCQYLTAEYSSSYTDYFPRAIKISPAAAMPRNS
jgi:hypothetical protein